MQHSSERGQCELADKRAWGWKEALEENRRRQRIRTVCALPGSHFPGCLDEKKMAKRELNEFTLLNRMMLFTFQNKCSLIAVQKKILKFKKNLSVRINLSCQQL